MSDATDVRVAREIVADSLASLADNVAPLLAAVELLAECDRRDFAVGLELVRLGARVQQAGDLLLGGRD